MSKETEIVIKKKFPNKEKQDGFPGEFYQTFEELMPVFFKLRQRIEEDRTLPSTFSRTRITLILKPGEDTAVEENHRPIFPVSTDPETLNKILAQQIQQDIERVTQ